MLDTVWDREVGQGHRKEAPPMMSWIPTSYTHLQLLQLLQEEQLNMPLGSYFIVITTVSCVFLKSVFMQKKKSKQLDSL